MLKKVIATATSVAVFCSSALVFAEETSTSTIGSFALVHRGETAPFDGVLLDPVGIATILAEDELKKEEFDLRINFSLSKERAKYQLLVDELKLSLKYNDQISTKIIEEKDKQIKYLLEQNSDNSGTIVITVGSFVIGVATTLMIIFFKSKIDK